MRNIIINQKLNSVFFLHEYLKPEPIKTANVFTASIFHVGRNNGVVVLGFLHPTNCLGHTETGEQKYKNSAEVDIAPAFGEITTACNVR